MSVKHLRSVIAALSLAAALTVGSAIDAVRTSADSIYTMSGTAHVQDYGDTDATFEDGVLVLGTTGQSKRLERVVINFENNTGYEGTITYQVHVQNIGWMDWVEAGEMAGTSGQSLRLEGIRIKLTGELAEHYSVYYSVHIQDYGDNQGWVCDGALAGTTGESKRLENLRVKLVARDESEGTETITYRVHRQTYGWESEWAADGETSGTTGESKRLEAIEIRVTGNQYSGGVEYSTHIQDIGWESESASDGSMSGTSGQSKRLEAIKISLTGELAEHYDVYYRVHAQSYGWLGWAKNGEEAGTAGLSKRLEAIQIVLVPTGEDAPEDVEGITSAYDTAFVDASSNIAVNLPSDYINNFRVYHEDDIALLNAIVGTSHRDYEYIDCTSNTEYVTSKTISNADWDACARFAASHFDSSWSAGEKALYTMYWIHYNVKYSAGTSSYAVSVFDNQKGQCAQYNGALVEMMCYLGFDDVRLIRSYRSHSATSVSNPFSHYWGEIVINGTNYCLECGNTNNDGGSYIWYYFVEPYGRYNAKKFMKCGLVLS